MMKRGTRVCIQSISEVPHENSLRTFQYKSMKRYFQMHKYTSSFSDRKMHSWIDHILIDKRQHENIVGRSFKRH
jgi:hypothetical protein